MSLLALVLACSPLSDVVVSAELGDVEVAIAYALRDLRTAEEDSILQLEELGSVVGMAETLSSEKRLPWLSPWTIELRSEDARLDLVLRATMSRAAFDKCASDASCESFPIERDAEGYRAKEKDWPTSRWPKDATRLEAHWRIDGKHPKTCTSLAPLHAKVRGAPNALARLADAIGREREAHFDEDPAALRALVEGPCDLGAPWCERVTEYRRRLAAGQAFAYLRNGQDKTAKGLKAPPVQIRSERTKEPVHIHPNERMSRAEDVRLRAIYDDAMRSYQAHGVMPTPRWGEVCHPKSMTTRERKDFCLRLGVP